MAAFKRRSTKNSDENQATNEQTELELDNVTENSNLENEEVQDSAEEKNADNLASPPKKKRTVVKKSSDTQKRQPSANVQNNRKYNTNRTFTGNIPQETLQTETHLPESMQDYESKPRLEINELTKKGMHELRELAIQYGFTADDLAPMKKQDLIFLSQILDILLNMMDNNILHIPIKDGIQKNIL